MGASEFPKNNLAGCLKRLTVNVDQSVDDGLVPVDGGEVERRVTLERKQTHSQSFRMFERCLTAGRKGAEPSGQVREGQAHREATNRTSCLDLFLSFSHAFLPFVCLEESVSTSAIPSSPISAQDVPVALRSGAKRLLAL